MTRKTSVLFISLLLVAAAAFAQRDSIQPPYKRFPTLPPFQLLLGDSATMYTKKALPKNKPVLLLLFSPDCSHCQHTAEEIVAQKDALQHIQIVLATLHPLWQMNAFATSYGLTALPNVVVGKDVNFILPPFFGVKNLPYMALYKKNGSLISTFEGSMSVEKVLQLFKNAGR